ncbi:Small integral membrane protein 8 [Anthophora retusa]
MDKKNPESAPGDGLRSLRSTSLFRAVNFELYAKQNKATMIFGIVAFVGCLGCIVYMRRNFDNSKHYTAVTSDGTDHVEKKVSKWTA